MSAQNTLLIINPTAGRTAAHKELFAALGRRCAADKSITPMYTSRAGEATDLARSLAAKFGRLVCCGGDGTLNEVLTGVQQSGARVPVGYIPAGTTNDLARSLRLPADAGEAIERAFSGPALPYDLGRFNGSRCFDYVASFGAFVDTAYTTPQSMKNALGRSAYLLWGATRVFRIRPFALRAEADGRVIEGDFLFGSVSNSTEIGGLIELPPDRVRLDDGKFEVLLIRRCHGLARLRQALDALHRRVDQNNICLFSTDHITFTFPQRVEWTLDGERAEPCARAEISALHGAVELVRGAEAPQS